MSLKDWEERNKWLVPHRTTKMEIADMFEVGDRNLRDSRVEGLSADARLITPTAPRCSLRPPHWLRAGIVRRGAATTTFASFRRSPSR